MRADLRHRRDGRQLQAKYDNMESDSWKRTAKNWKDQRLGGAKCLEDRLSDLPKQTR